MIRIEVDAREALRVLRASPRATRRAVVRWLPKVGSLAAGRMKHFIQKTTSQNATGRLAASVEVRIGEGAVEVGPTVAYAAFANWPTRPHEILPVRAKALTVPSLPGGVVGRRGGRAVTRLKLGRGPSGRERVAVRPVLFLRRVHHPGTRGLHYLENTETDLRSSRAAERLLDEEVARALREEGGA